MGASSSGSSNSGGGRTDAGPNRTTAYKAGVGNITESGKKTPSYKSSNDDAFRNRGAVKIKAVTKKIPTPTMLLASKPLQFGSKVTRDFYVNKVLGSKNFKGQSKTSFLSMSSVEQEKQYKSYLDSRMSGQTDAYGNTINQGNDNNNPQGIELAKSATGSATVKGPGEIQKDAANNKGTTDTLMTAAQINIANKRKGKKVTNQTAKTVLTEDYKLSKKKLLG